MLKKELTIILILLFFFSCISKGYTENETYKGYATVYGPIPTKNKGSCGFGKNNRFKYYVALNEGNANWEYKQGENCGRYVSITNPQANNGRGLTITAEVVDSCNTSNPENKKWCSDTPGSKEHIALGKDLADTLGHSYETPDVKMTWKFLDSIPSDAPNSSTPYAITASINQNVTSVIPVNSIGALPESIHWKSNKSSKAGTAIRNSTHAWYDINENVDASTKIQIPGQPGWYSINSKISNPNITQPDSRFVPYAGTSCLQDTKTGLVWYNNGKKFVNSWTELNNEFPQDGSGSDVLCGQTGWRMPTLAEYGCDKVYGSYCTSDATGLITNWDGGSPADYLNNNGFTSVQALFYWSSTEDATNNQSSWLLGMFNNSIVYTSAKAAINYVLPVRKAW